ncbi:MAG: helix-turn-helix domain-containing protein [Trichlorobacter sp.]|nr:helix-turn-helix domain-containing protein [Trichlorobacter sp.]
MAKVEDLQKNMAETSETATISVGELLKQQRQAADRSLEEMAEATKISKSHLLAIENNRFEDLPGPAYLKGFVRLYAEQLGMDANQLLTQLNQQHKTTPEEMPGIKLEKPDKPVLSRIQRYTLPLLLFIALLASTLFFQPDNKDVPTPLAPTSPAMVTQNNEPEQNPENEQTETTANTATTSDTADLKTDEAAKDNAEQTPLPEAVKPEPVQTALPRIGFMVKMKVHKNATITVTIDENITQEYQVTAGDIIEWKAVRNIELDLSDAGSVALELDGKPLNPKAVPGKPLHLLLGAEGIIP